MKGKARGEKAEKVGEKGEKVEKVAKAVSWLRVASHGPVGVEPWNRMTYSTYSFKRMMTKGRPREYTGPWLIIQMILTCYHIFKAKNEALSRNGMQLNFETSADVTERMAALFRSCQVTSSSKDEHAAASK